MHKPLGLVIGSMILAVHAVAGNFNTSIAVQERCELCKNYLSLKYLDLNGIETYDGFEGFHERYKEYQEFGIDNPEVICMLTDMCPLYEELVITLNLIEGDDDMELQEIPETELISLNPLCYVCKKLVKWIIKQLMHLHDKRRNKGVVRGFIAKGCKHLIKPLRNPCHKFITKYSGKIVKALIKHLGPRLACILLYPAARVC